DSLSVITSETGLRRCSRYTLQALQILQLITSFHWRGYVIRDSEHIARIINPRDWEIYFDL
ncbi:MAG TPA: hypothetical protein PLZ67_05960, partial [Bacteroidales bacterium]|nr:hypothetical protein [Bacteroidales bacterium]